MPSIVTAVLSIALLHGAAAQVTNPVKSSAKWLANVTSSNSIDSRDLGWMGKIGNCYFNTFGDTVPCTAQNPQTGCIFSAIDARNSGGIPNARVGSFADLYVNASTKRVNAQFVPHISPETASYGLGITNVVQTGDNTGIIYYLPWSGNFDSNNNPYIQGAGAATVTITNPSTCAVTVTRNQRNWWKGNDPSQGATETWYGDHGAILAQDGYIYAFGQIPGGQGLGVARAKQAAAGDMSQYSYWNGKSWQTQRIMNPTDAISVLTAGQGSITWSPFYGMYLYFAACGGFAAGACIQVAAAHQPQGPWSDWVTLFTVDQNP